MKIAKIFLGTLLVLTGMGQKGHGQDWANLNKYKSENEQLLQKMPTTKSVVFMGDSITEFWSRESPEYFQEQQYINRGISGQTTSQMLLRFRSDVIALKPAVVVILAGINDIAENTGPIALPMVAGNIASMIDLAKAHNIKVILCSVLPAASFNWNKKIEPAMKVMALNDLLMNYADANGIPYVDYFSALVDDNNGLPLQYAEDGVHPNRAGYKIMEPIVQRAINLDFILK
jgi:lysophospholipase L1-like esterase